MTDPVADETIDRSVRLHVFSTAATTGKIPGNTETAQALGLTQAMVEESLVRLAAGKALVLAPNNRTIWMANPFSAVPSAFRVRASGRTYFAPCIWDALGIPAILGADAELETSCGDCGSQMRLAVRDGGLAREEGLVHFAVPALQWWDNIGFT